MCPVMRHAALALLEPQAVHRVATVLVPPRAQLCPPLQSRATPTVLPVRQAPLASPPQSLPALPLYPSMGVKLNERFKKFHFQLFRDDARNVALEATVQALETGRVFIELAPVPGLSAVVDVLVGILKKVQVSDACSICDRRLSLHDVQDTKTNNEDLERLRIQIEAVHTAIQSVAETVKKRVENIPSDSPDRIAAETKLGTTKNLGLTVRVDELKRCGLLAFTGSRVDGFRVL